MIQNYNIELLQKLSKNDFLDILYTEFNNKNYKEIIEIKNYLILFKRNYLLELDIIYYIILSLIEENLIYELLGLIDNLKIKDGYKEYFNNDESNYLNLLNDDIESKETLILLIFLNTTDILDKGQLIISLLSLISNLYELGYDLELINKLNKDLTQII